MAAGSVGDVSRGSGWNQDLTYAWKGEAWEVGLKKGRHMLEGLSCGKGGHRQLDLCQDLGWNRGHLR